MSGTAIFLGALLAAILIVLAAADIRHRILPNELNLMLGLAGLGQAAVAGKTVLVGAALGATVCGGLLGALAFGYRRYRGVDGLGAGDLKLGIAGGLWTGWEQVPWMLSIAALSALLFLGARALGRTTQLEERIPFGPFLCTGILSSWLLASPQYS